MLVRVARAYLGANKANGVTAVLASAFLLSSCGSFDFLGSAPPPAPPPAAAPAPSPVADNTFWPTHGWRTSSPEAQGIDPAVLADALDQIRTRHIPVNSLLIERHGSIVLDAYFYPYADDHTHDVASVTKSVTSTLVGIAMAEHRLDRLDAPVETLLPDTKPGDDPRKARITLANLLSMTSGLDCSDSGGRNFLQQMESNRHWADYAFARPETGEPGSTFTYCAGNMHLVSAVLTRATGESAADYAREKLFAPLGIDDASWPKDADGISHGFADLKLSPRDMAKLGYLWLHHGAWDGRQVVPASYVADALTPHANVQPDIAYGYGMWIYPQRGHVGGPADFEANGHGGQRIAVIPSEDIVEVITGNNLDANDVASLVAGAVKSETAMPDNAIADARLAMRLAEAQTGATFELASVVPAPRPDPGVVASTPVLAAALLTAVPKPRPGS